MGLLHVICWASVPRRMPSDHGVDAQLSQLPYDFCTGHPPITMANGHDKDAQRSDRGWPNDGTLQSLQLEKRKALFWARCWSTTWYFEFSYEWSPLWAAATSTGNAKPPRVGGLLSKREHLLRKSPVEFHRASPWCFTS